MGLLYEEGRGGLKRSDAKAFQCFSAAADLGNSEAQ